MNKNINGEVSNQDVYEIKGQIELLRGDIAHYFKQVGFILWLILISLIWIAIKS